MKKASLFILVTLIVSGCSSTSTKQEMFFEAASACNQVCEANPAIKEISSKAGGGLPLVFLGGMETSCHCQR